MCRHCHTPQQAPGTCTINMVLINYGEKLLLAQEPRLVAYKVNALMLSFKEHFHQLKPTERFCDYLNPSSFQSPEFTVLQPWALTRIVVAKEGSESITGNRLS